MRSQLRLLLIPGLCISLFAQDPYKRNDKADINGTFLVANADLIPVFLVETFGKPGEGDGYKVSGCYTFVPEKGGDPFTVYDWKLTNLFDEDENAPSPKALWASEKPMEFSIGGRVKNASAFTEWLLEKQKEWLKRRGKVAAK